MEADLYSFDRNKDLLAKKNEIIKKISETLEKLHLSDFELVSLDNGKKDSAIAKEF